MFANVSGTYVLAVPGDVTLLNNSEIVLSADVSAAVCNITLPAISSFLGTYAVRITVNDVNAAAATYPITITCDATDLINNRTSCVINTNGGCAVLRITDVHDWAADITNNGLPVVAVSATATGTGAGLIPNGNCFVVVTSTGANNIVTLPAPVQGSFVKIQSDPTTAFELRSTSPTTISINGGTGAAAESAIPANVLVVAECNSSSTWIGNTFTSSGSQVKVEIAAP